MKWVIAVSQNNERGIPAIHATLLLNDPVTGVPIAILDAGPITAERTAATSGVAIRPGAAGRRPRAAGRAHRRRGPGPEPRAGDRARAAGRAARGVRPGPGRAEALAAYAPTVDGIEARPWRPTRAPRRGRGRRRHGRVVRGPARAPGDDRRLARARHARRARGLRDVLRGLGRPRGGLFVVDHLDQFLANREAGQFDGYPDPGAMIGEALDSTPARTGPSGRVVATHLGTGLADVVFGSAILAAAEARGLGTVLPR